MITFLFPGQGSQQVGMGADLVKTPQGKAAFAQAEEVLGYDLREICVEGPGDELQRTLYTQPALYVVGGILADLLKDRGFKPGAVAGHSAGEYAALYAAGVFDFASGLKIVGRRAQLMDEAGTKTGGTMAAVIGMDTPGVEKLVEDLGAEGVLSVAAYNAEGQTVISGEKDLVIKAAEEAKPRGARMAKVLSVSGAFHSNLMKEASETFAEFMKEIPFQAPRIPFVSNATGKVEKDPEVVKSVLSDLLIKPVRWTECLGSLIELKPERFLEVGPGNVLAGLLKRFDRSLALQGVASLEDVENLSM